MANQAKYALGVDFQVQGVPIKGIYSSGVLYGEVNFDEDQGRLKDIVPDDLKSVTPDVKVDSIFCTLKGLKEYLFGVEFGDINLTNLPLVGSKLPKNLKILVKNPELQIASGDFSVQEEKTPIKKGVNFSAKLQLGPVSFPLQFAPPSPDKKTQQVIATTKAVTTKVQQVQQAQKSSGDGVFWIGINRTVGPLYFRRIGASLKGNELRFYLDATINIAAATLAFEGLSVGSPLDNFSPTFDLRGLGIFFESGAISIGGALLRGKTMVAGKEVETYDGMVRIKTPAFGMTALGSYCEVNKQPSLFIFGVLELPLGGPPFLFVTGLAAGFGLNRYLKVPPVEKINQFPFVAAAMGSGSSTNDPFQLLRTINDDIPPDPGQYFLAFGIKFTSFKLIDSFALLTFGFGKKLTLDVIGLSRLSVPPTLGAPISPLAQVEMAFRVGYDFDENALKMKAVLTENSYILSRNCQLTGGFAFYAWFGGEHAGDFVLTLGGYHPSFKVPKHYPTVPRLGFNWKITNDLTMSGGAYFALTASAVMAGGSFNAVWASGNIKAWFKIGLDLILSWKPYFYEANVYASMGVQYRLVINLGFLGKIKKTFKVSIGAELKIWGPDFSGYATIDLKVISFKIRFGARNKPKISTLDWQEFATSFLPEPKDIGVLNVKEGLLKTTESKINVVDPDDFTVAFNTVIPISKTNLNTTAENASFGIGTMGVVEADSELKLTVFEGNREVTEDFTFTPIQKNMPPALWGKADKPGVYKKADVNGGLLPNLLTGFTITPSPKPSPAKTEQKDLEAFAYDVEVKKDSFEWQSPFQQTKQKATISETIGKSFEARTDLLEELGLDMKEVSLAGLTTDTGCQEAFLAQPKIVELTSK